jgi:hypothetical protein
MYSKNNNFEEMNVTGVNAVSDKKSTTIKSAVNSNEQSKSSYRKIKLKSCGKRV